MEGNICSVIKAHFVIWTTVKLIPLKSSSDFLHNVSLTFQFNVMEYSTKISYSCDLGQFNKYW